MEIAASLELLEKQPELEDADFEKLEHSTNNTSF
jgi:hypothetical protein